MLLNRFCFDYFYQEITRMYIYVNQGRLFSIDIDFWKLLILYHMTEIVFIFNFKVYTIEVLTNLFLTEKS